MIIEWTYGTFYQQPTTQDSFVWNWSSGTVEVAVVIASNFLYQTVYQPVFQRVYQPVFGDRPD